MSLAHDAFVVVHLEERLHLGHGVEVDADEDEQARASKEVGKLAREIEELRHDARDLRRKSERKSAS